MSENVIKFRKRREPDVAARAADEHLLVAMTHRDALLTDPAISHSYIEFKCMEAAIEGAVEFLRAEDPCLTDTGLARRLGEVVLHYCRTKLGARE